MLTRPAQVDNAFVTRSALLALLVACLLATGEVERDATRGPSLAAATAAVKQRIRRIRVAPSGGPCFGGTCYFTGGPSGKIEIPVPGT